MRIRKYWLGEFIPQDIVLQILVLTERDGLLETTLMLKIFFRAFANHGCLFWDIEKTIDSMLIIICGIKSRELFDATTN